MAKARTLVGLDVHAAKTVAAILDAETGELRFERLNGSTERTVGLCSSLPAPVRATYEAGPTGYRLARRLRGAGIDCLVAAPGKIPRGATDRVRTDRRDAEHLVRLLLAGRLHPVWVPGPEEEALRDLVRAREDLRTDLMRLAGLEMEHEGAPGGPARLPRRGRLAGSSSPGSRGCDRAPGAGLALGASGGAASLPARDRHPDGGRPLLRGG